MVDLAERIERHHKDMNRVVRPFLLQRRKEAEIAQLLDINVVKESGSAKSFYTVIVRAYQDLSMEISTLASA